VKICWDNLEKLVYKGGYFYKLNKKVRYTYSISKYPCIVCKNDFIGRTKFLIEGKSKFCSYECHGKFSILNKSEEQKDKFIKSNKGKKISEEIKEKVRNKISNSSSHLWKGGFFKRNIVSFDQFEDVLKQFHEIRRNKSDPDILETRCIYCGKWYIPTHREVNNRVKAIYHDGRGGRNLYCSEDCKQECPTYKQMFFPKGFKPSTSREVQPELRKLVFERDDYTCQKCLSIVNLHCHHIDPVINNPIESADINNCITLCKECHKEVHKKSGCRYNELRC